MVVLTHEERRIFLTANNDDGFAKIKDAFPFDLLIFLLVQRILCEFFSYFIISSCHTDRRPRFEEPHRVVLNF